jgi:hypothetical protein
MFPGKEGSYIYLFLLREKDKPHNECHPSRNGYYTYGNLERARISLFKAIRKSLHSYAPGKDPWEMQFANFTLNMSGILLSETAHFLPCPQLFKDQFEKQVEIALYSGGVKELKPTFVFSGLAQCSICEFEDFQFQRKYTYGNGSVDGYLKSLNLV